MDFALWTSPRELQSAFTSDRVLQHPLVDRDIVDALRAVTPEPHVYVDNSAAGWSLSADLYNYLLALSGSTRSDNLTVLYPRPLVDVCVVTYRNSAARIRPAVRRTDKLWVRDNTTDNIGFAAGANALAGMGNDPIILFINPDLDPAEGCFDALDDGLEDAGRIAVGGSDSANGGSDRDAPWLSGACLAVRRSAFERVGGFDESLFMYAEDVDLSYRLAPLGRLSYVAAAVYSHDGGRRPFRSEFLQARNFIVVQRRHGKPSAWWPTLRSGGGSLLRGDTRLGIARIGGAVASVTRR